MCKFEIREDIVNFIKSGWIVAELGVFKAEFSEILYKKELDKLILVDPFMGYICSGDKNGNNIEILNGDLLFESSINKFKDRNNVTIVRAFSQIFLNQLPDNFLDMVYIDTTHEYNQTLTELELSKNKVKEGGIISGHDYDINRFPDVYNAVNEFSAKYNLEIFKTINDGLASFLMYNS